MFTYKRKPDVKYSPHQNRHIIDQIKESDAVIISDYNKGFLNESILYEITYSRIIMSLK